jgi:hypothetical protein
LGGGGGGGCGGGLRLSIASLIAVMSAWPARQDSAALGEGDRHIMRGTGDGLGVGQVDG